MADASSVPTGIHVRFIDDIAVMWLNNGENRLNLNSLQGINEALDQIERNESTKALIIAGVGKYFSCGLDLDWLSKQDKVTVRSFLAAYINFHLRMLVYPMPTVAAINGHSYAAGAITAMTCDYRIMRTQRGWICFPEININLVFQNPIIELLRMKLPDNIVFRDMVMYGQKLTGEEAKQRGVVDDCVDMKDLMDTALAFTKKKIGPKGFDRAIVQQMKQNLYGIKMEMSESRDDITKNDRGLSPRERFERALKARL